eukprot:SAG25_NODE_1540_length_2822_cov_1.731546_2_plen_195_part_00
MVRQSARPPARPLSRAQRRAAPNCQRRSLAQLTQAPPPPAPAPAVGYRDCFVAWLSHAGEPSQRAVAALAAAAAVWVADGNRFFNRSGPGVVESAVIVAQVAAGGVPVGGERDLRGLAGFLSLEEALALEGETLETGLLGVGLNGGQPQPPQAPGPTTMAATAALGGALSGVRFCVCLFLCLCCVVCFVFSFRV